MQHTVKLFALILYTIIEIFAIVFLKKSIFVYKYMELIAPILVYAELQERSRDREAALRSAERICVCKFFPQAYVAESEMKRTRSCSGQ